MKKIIGPLKAGHGRNVVQFNGTVPQTHRLDHDSPKESRRMVFENIPLLETLVAGIARKMASH